MQILKKKIFNSYKNKLTLKISKFKINVNKLTNYRKIKK